MRVRKEVNLTLETAQIAEKMNNFSQWVRMGLLAEARQESLASEMMLRLKWVGTARLLAAALIEKSLEIDPSYKGTVDSLCAKAMTQTSLDKWDN